MALFEKLSNTERFEVSVWFERDRQNVTLTYKQSGKEIFSLWDEDVSDALESGYLVAPRHSRPSDSDWLAPAVDYAVSMGLIERA